MIVIDEIVIVIIFCKFIYSMAVSKEKILKKKVRTYVHPKLVKGIISGVCPRIFVS